MKTSTSSLTSAFAAVARAAQDMSPVAGWTHNFYRYPARFSPRFAAEAISRFSKPGDLVLDPYMGGGTAIVEGMLSGRQAVGNDLNSLGAFVAAAKTTKLSCDDVEAVERWVTSDVPRLTYRFPYQELACFIDNEKTRNLTLAKARFIKKAMAAAMATIEGLPSKSAINFARCAVLRVGQWALDGRERHTSVAAFRDRLAVTTKEMLAALAGFVERAWRSGGTATILNGDASEIGCTEVFRGTGRCAAPL